mmetsp:Transcript_19774/g.47359  ORF Transcript_19774/g.47359 Transcript_19774/m.47359 type:complete len:89 (-) Transcript_19774:771-1037(-)
MNRPETPSYHGAACVVPQDAIEGIEKRTALRAQTFTARQWSTRLRRATLLAQCARECACSIHMTPCPISAPFVAIEKTPGKRPVARVP